VVTYSGNRRPLLPGDDPNVGHFQRVFALKYHPDENSVFISGGWDNALKVIWIILRHCSVMSNCLLEILSMTMTTSKSRLTDEEATRAPPPESTPDGRLYMCYVFISQIWDCRTARGLQSVIPGPHISGDGLDIKVQHRLNNNYHYYYFLCIS